MLLSLLAVSLLKRVERRGQAGAVAADTQVAWWRDTEQKRRVGDEHKHANKHATVAPDGTSTQGPQRAAHREAH